MTLPGALLPMLASPAAPLAAAEFDGLRLVALVVLLVILQVFKQVAAARKERAEQDAAREQRAEAHAQRHAPSPAAQPPAPPSSAKPSTAGSGAGSRKPLLTRAPDMAHQRADHPSHHEHLADLTAAALKSDPHPGHLKSEKHPGALASEKHPGAHPSTVTRASGARRSGRSLLLSASLSAPDRVRSAVLWHEVLGRRRTMAVPPRRATSGPAAPPPP